MAVPEGERRLDVTRIRADDGCRCQNAYYWERVR
jgi:hypothetical protein